MFLEFLDDRTTHYLDRQYMLGPSLLVAPVFVPKEEKSEYYIPAGRWTSFFHPERVVQGPVWIKELVPLDEIPVWVRPGTILCLGPEKTGRPDYDYSKSLVVQLYELAEGQTVETSIPGGKGVEVVGTIRASRKSGEIRVTVVNGASDLSSINVFSEGATAKGVVGGTINSSTGIRVDVETGATEVVIHLA
jgi:alpha-glucosidase (family GH31 glycosyl hydrolase)